MYARGPRDFQRAIRHGQCKGKDVISKFLGHGQRAFMWKVSSAARRRALRQAWALSNAEEAAISKRAKNVGPGHWERSLPEDGDVERQPGPLWAMTLNSNGAGSSYRALSLASDDRYDILALQETRMGPRQMAQWIALCSLWVLCVGSAWP